MRNHLYQYIRAPKLNLHTRHDGQHRVHHRDHQKHQGFRPKPASALRLFQEFQFPIKLHRQDQYLRYSFSVNINSFQRLYKLQKLTCAPILSQALP